MKGKLWYICPSHIKISLHFFNRLNVFFLFVHLILNGSPSAFKLYSIYLMYIHHTHTHTPLSKFLSTVLLFHKLKKKLNLFIKQVSFDVLTEV